MNPFEDPRGSGQQQLFRGTRMAGCCGGLPAGPPSPLTSFVHDSLRALVLSDQFVCVGGKSAFRQGTYRFGLYPSSVRAPAAPRLARDLFTFVEELPVVRRRAEHLCRQLRRAASRG